MPDDVKLKVNGKAVSLPRGSVVAAAVALAGFAASGHSVRHEPRGPLCGMGVCFECCVTINGQGYCRSCLTLCEEGMEVQTDGQA
jgi:D-hydroxyproline dehydrogenase subunit gamma